MRPHVDPEHFVDMEVACPLLLGSGAESEPVLQKLPVRFNRQLRFYHIAQILGVIHQ